MERTGGGPIYAFPSTLAADDETLELTTEVASLVPNELGGPGEMMEVEAGKPCFVLIVGDRVVSICRTARLVHDVAQAGVNTLEAYRGRGYGSRVVATWAAAMRQRGVEPMYSTWFANAASRSLARKLGLILVGVDFNVY